MKLTLDPEATVTVDLAHAMAREMPNHASAPAYFMTPHIRFGDFELEDGYWGTNELLIMSGHSGTHLDALCHVARDGRLHGGHDVFEAQRGAVGTRVHGVESIGPIVRRGVLLDVARHRNADVLAPDHVIGADELREVAEGEGIDIRAGDCVLIRTGVARYWDDPVRYLNLDGGVPGIDLTAAEWLSERGVFLIGCDNSAVEYWPAKLRALPVHLYCLVDRGIFLLENLALDDLSEARAREFLFVCLPLKLTGASGSPVRPVAVLAG